MAERFTKLQAFPENLYTDMAPVVIVAGNLLKDNQLSRVLAQLKIKNIDKRTVDEITLLFRLMDANGKILNDAYEYKVEHAGIMENDYYGSKNPITIPDSNVKSCEVRVTRVQFTDGTIWSSLSKWNPLEPTATLDELKATRDRKVSEEERIRQLKEQEERKLAKIEKARAKKKLTIVAIILAIIVCISPIVFKKIEEFRQIAEEKALQEKKEAIVEALVGTSWQRTHEYPAKDGEEEKVYKYDILTFEDQNWVREQDDIFGTKKLKWEVLIYNYDDEEQIYIDINNPDFSPDDFGYDRYYERIYYSDFTGEYKVSFEMDYEYDGVSIEYIEKWIQIE